MPFNMGHDRRFYPALILLAGLLPSAWLLGSFTDAPQLGMMGDDVMYIGSAQSLAQVRHETGETDVSH